MGMDTDRMPGTRLIPALILAALLHIPGPAAADVVKDCTQKGDWWLRITACTQAIESGKYAGRSAAWAYSNRAVAHVALGQYIQAFDDHREAIKLDPTSATARNNKANAHARFREYDRALEEYSAAIRLKAGYTSAHFNRAGVHVALGQDVEAIADYSAVIKGRPDLGAAYAGRAEARCRTGDVEGSVADRLSALELGALTSDLIENHLSETGYLRGDVELEEALGAWTRAGCP
ncbi:MAG: tetratricopeptide repeat protein [Pseudomonadota bacterium]